jgi:hypothetical protein
MESTMTKKHDKHMHDLNQRMSEESRLGDLNRARSVSIGTAFGGVTEISMRCNDGRTVWAIMQPVEVLELIHQLAANVGCHINVQPRDDFSSWRSWRVTEEEKKHLNGHPPHPNDMALHNDVGAKLPPPEQQPGMQPALMAKEQQDEPMAIKES